MRSGERPRRRHRPGARATSADRRVGFIGAPDTGPLIQRQAAEAAVKYVSLELGGKNALIVMPDADLDKAIDSAVFGMNYTATAGQSCGSTSRLLLHESIADRVLDGVVEQVRAIRVGHPLETGSQIGPVIAKNHYDKSMDAVTAGQAQPSHVRHRSTVSYLLFAEVYLACLSAVLYPRGADGSDRLLLRSVRRADV